MTSSRPKSTLHQSTCERDSGKLGLLAYFASTKVTRLSLNSSQRYSAILIDHQCPELASMVRHLYFQYCPENSCFANDSLDTLIGLSKQMHDIEAVQKRPGMYVGDTADGMGLHNMLFEVIGNSINEGLAGHCTAIEISINPDGSATVRDNGRGISFERHPSFGKSAAEVVFTCLYPDFRRSWRSSQKRIHGVGLCVVNALSDKLECLVTQNGKEYLLRFRMGYLEGTLATCDKTVRQQSVNMLRGTEITFLPSQRYFSNPVFEFSKIVARLNLLQGQGAGISISLIDLNYTARNEMFQV